MPDILRRIVRGQRLDPLPRRLRRRWGSRVRIILDRSERLVPFWEELNGVARRLLRLFPRGMVEMALAQDGSERPWLVDSRGGRRPWTSPEPGSLVLVLGDLGCLAGAEASRAFDRWEGMGQELRARECRTAAVTPCPPARWLPARFWTMVPMEGGGPGARPSQEEREAAALRLLRLLSPAARVEPGLLREIRRLAGMDAGVEADVWTHPFMACRYQEAGGLDVARVRELRRAFAEDESPEMREDVILRMHRWRAGAADLVWYEELLQLPEAILPSEIRENDLAAARNHFTARGLELVAAGYTGREWFRQVDARAGHNLYGQGDQALKRVLQGMYLEARRGDPEHNLPAGFDLRLLPPVHEKPRPIDLWQRGCHCLAGAAAGGYLGTIRSRQDLVSVEAVAEPWQPPPTTILPSGNPAPRPPGPRIGAGMSMGRG